MNSFFLTVFCFHFSFGYIYVSTPLNWVEAQTYCVNNYASNLATIISSGDISTANSDITNSGETWIGLYSQNKNGWWSFINGESCMNTISGECIDLWGALDNEPLCIPNQSGFECAYYDDDQSSVYNDLNCSQQRPFLCQEDNASPPIQDNSISYVGNCPCSNVNIGECSNNVITIMCTEPNLSFDESTDAIRSCIDIDRSIIPNAVTIKDVIVSTAFSHTYVGDLEAYLQHGSDLITLFDAYGGSDNVNVILSDSASLVPAGSNIDASLNGFGIGGTRRPLQPLSTFDDDQANGRWSIYVYDKVSLDSGIFGTWSLTLTVSECQPKYQTEVSYFNDNATKFYFCPTKDPTTEPTMEPTMEPTIEPTADPTTDPTADPTTDPTADPTADPTTEPTADPTIDPTADPTTDPTADPTADPTTNPTTYPTTDPTQKPTTDPTSDPTVQPTIVPTPDPTSDPTADPRRNKAEGIKSSNKPALPAYALFLIIFGVIICIMISIYFAYKYKQKQNAASIHQETITAAVAVDVAASEGKGKENSTEIVTTEKTATNESDSEIP